MQGNAGQLASALGTGARGDGSRMSVPDVKGDEDRVSDLRQISFLCRKKKIRKLFNYHF